MAVGSGPGSRVHETGLARAISGRLTTFTGPTSLKFVFDGVKVSVKGQAFPQVQTVSDMAW